MMGNLLKASQLCGPGTGLDRV